MRRRRGHRRRAATGARGSGAASRDAARAQAVSAAARAALRDEADARDEVAGRHHGPAGADVVAHARKLVEARLHDLETAVVEATRFVAELDHERLELVAQVAHRRDASHARAAFQRVQHALELGHWFAVAARRLERASAASADSRSSVASSLKIDATSGS